MHLEAAKYLLNSLDVLVRAIRITTRQRTESLANRIARFEKT